MARQCEICGKGHAMGNAITTRGKAKYLGGVGTKVTGIARRKFKPNLQRLKVTVGHGTNTTKLVCTQCIRGGLVTKTVRHAPFKLSKTEEAKTGKPAAGKPATATAKK
jgi:large subunit ribosomal protein L28